MGFMKTVFTFSHVALGADDFKLTHYRQSYVMELSSQPFVKQPIGQTPTRASQLMYDNLSSYGIFRHMRGGASHSHTWSGSETQSPLTEMFRDSIFATT